MAETRDWASGLHSIGEGTADQAMTAYGYATPASIDDAIQQAGTKGEAALNAIENLTVKATSVDSAASASSTLTGVAPNLTLNLSIPRGRPGLDGGHAMDASANRRGLTPLLRAMDAGEARIVVMGDSNSEGFFLQEWDQRWMNVLRDKLRTRWNLTGDTGRGYLPATYNTPGDNPPKPARGGAAANTYPAVDFGGLGMRSLWMTGDGTVTWPALTFSATTPLRVLLVRRPGHGSAEVLVDGAVKATVATGGTDAIIPVDITVTAGSHVVSARGQGGSTVQIAGIEHRTGQGVAVYDGALSGATARTFTDPSPGQALHWSEVQRIDPHLLIVALGANDMAPGQSYSRTPQEWEDGLRQIVALRDQHAPDAGLLLLHGAAPANDPAGLDRVREFEARARAALEDAPRASILYLSSLWQPRLDHEYTLMSSDPDGWLTDGVHMTAAAHAQVADLILAAVATTKSEGTAAAEAAAAAAQQAASDAAAAIRDNLATDINTPGTPAYDALVDAAGTITDPQIASQIGNPSTDTRQALDGIVATSLSTTVREGDLVLNVYDYGATNDPVASSQTALDAVMTEARARRPNTQRGGVTIRLPHGQVRGNLTVDQPMISVEGPGALLGQVKIGPSVTNGLMDMMGATVRNVRFRPVTRTDPCGVYILGAWNVTVWDNAFLHVDQPVVIDSWDTNAHFQQNKMISVVRNTFKHVGTAVRIITRPGASWGATADCIIADNISNLTFDRFIDADSVDGLVVANNVSFMVGYRQSSGADGISAADLRARKAESVLIRGTHNFVNVIGNEWYEAGASGMRFVDPITLTVNGNQVVWPGQHQPGDGIEVHLPASRPADPARVLITGNEVQSATRHGISVTGAGDASRVVIDDTNRVELHGDTTRNSYYGSDPLTPASMFRVNVASTLEALPQVSVAHGAGVVNAGHSSIGGRKVSSHRPLMPGAVASSVTPRTANVVSGNTAIVNLGDAKGGKTTYAGRVSVVAQSQDGTALAHYVLSVSKSRGARSVTLLGASGSTAGDGQASTPAFTWAVNSSDQLYVIPAASVAGQFTFDLTAEGDLVPYV